ncbi:MAG: UDP-2,3-diacylglucosamine diphosphatase, partial [Cytophagales bacterium]
IYKHVAPKGFIRFLGKIAELTDSGIQVFFFTGNHDMWMFDYLPQELNVKIFRKPLKLFYDNKKFFLHHGDGLGSFDQKYKFIKWFFNSRICQKMFAFLHPMVGFWIATTWSSKSRKANHKNDEVFLGEKEWLLQFAKSNEEKEHFDYYVFGHRHLKMEVSVGKNSKYINLGEWFSSPYFLVVSETEVDLLAVNEFLIHKSRKCLNQV